ncbi:Zn-ribbon domain-containing OB-fold protein [Nocardioides halotolerans]|uniref:Zn-ribbon domain-containing OB-fold protein n=1 Tax=Nocardioides halotolerans TaxID=433660 RepID=UPI0004908981|nr:OB-fold domain-containing protein [Nocardioides halotolerans]
MSEPAREPVAKPQPTVTEENRPFWDGARAGTLRMQRCASCDHIRFPIQALCPRCLGDGFSWQDLSGDGEVFSSIVYRRAFHPAYREDVPYNLVMVQLTEGPRMFSNVIGVEPGSVRVGDRVRVVFEPVSDEISVPRFELAGSTPLRT